MLRGRSPTSFVFAQKGSMMKTAKSKSSKKKGSKKSKKSWSYGSKGSENFDSPVPVKMPAAIVVIPSPYPTPYITTLAPEQPLIPSSPPPTIDTNEPNDNESPVVPVITDPPAITNIPVITDPPATQIVTGIQDQDDPADGNRIDSMSIAWSFVGVASFLLFIILVAKRRREKSQGALPAFVALNDDEDSVYEEDNPLPSGDPSNELFNFDDAEPTGSPVS